jgi:hypothetical protein
MASSAAPVLSPCGSSGSNTGAQQVQGSQDHSKKGDKQDKSGTMYLNEFQQRPDENNTVWYDEYKCRGFTEDKPLYGCRAIVNDVVRGQANNHPNQKAARKAAAYQAAKALGLVTKQL